MSLLPGVTHRWVRFAVAVGSLTLLGGCSAGGGADPHTSPARKAELTILKRRVDIAPGHPAIIPVSLSGGARAPDPAVATLDDGRSMPTTLTWVGVRREPTTPAGRWLGLAGPWSTSAGFFEGAPPAVGFWSLVLELPADAAGQGVWIDGRRVDLNWLPSQSYLRGITAPDDWAPPLGTEALGRPGLSTFTEQARRDPFLRWRVRLLEDGLAPDASAEEGAIDAHRFSDPVLESLAATLEARWRAVFAHLRAQDRELARLMRRRLALVCDMGWGLWAPVWDQSPAEIDALLDSLLDPEVGAAERRRAAYAWLEGQASAEAWVIDDAGLDDADGLHRVVTLGMSNLGAGREVAWATPAGTPRIEDLTPVAPASTIRLGVATPIEASAARIVARLGRWSRVLEAMPAPLPAVPPGATIGPLALDWTARTWTGETTTREPRQAGRTMALVQRGAGGGKADWSVYIEAEWPDGLSADEASDDSARVWLGAFGRPAAVIRVWADGRTARERPVGSASVAASVLREEDRWIAVVPVPAEAIEPSGLLRVGLERIRPDARRSAWPRPMHPWQSEPGRLAIDTNAWDAGAR